MLIAQFSDIHLKPNGMLAYDVADTLTALKRTIDHINSLYPQPDVIIGTGDLADEGAPEAYELLSCLLAQLKSPLYLLPGNHDHKIRLQNAFPDHRYLRQTVTENGYFYICYAIDTYPIRLVGIDTATPGRHGGDLGPERLHWLENILSQKPHQPTVIFMHHPPFATAIGHMDKSGFEGRKGFEHLIQNHPQVERILCGHLHRPIFRCFGGTIASVCPGIGMQLKLDLRPEAPSGFVMEPPAIMLHMSNSLWDEDPVLLTHISLIEEKKGQFGGFHPFFKVVNPELNSSEEKNGGRS
ncbi:MAG: phosphodiesterase [Deltaproteobacteria bacterium]|jgi:3',5'-cyclic-AMP phosphodiesterase|nr:phosphodiesterase [Deltaproteobacteria bacterium]